MTSPVYRVLCVEDDADTCELITIWLRNAENDYDVVAIESLREAFELIQAGSSFDIYIIDSWLTDGSGLAICTTIRETDQQTPIMFFSAVAQEAEKEKALAAGANAYLTKPIISDQFISAVEELIRPKTLSAPKN